MGNRRTVLGGQRTHIQETKVQGPKRGRPSHAQRAQSHFGLSAASFIKRDRVTGIQSDASSKFGHRVRPDVDVASADVDGHDDAESRLGHDAAEYRRGDVVKSRQNIVHLIHSLDYYYFKSVINFVDEEES